MEQFLLPQPVVAKIIAMVAGEDDEGFIPLASFFQMLEKPAKMGVDLRDEAHIGGDHRAPACFLGEALAFAMGHEGGGHRVGGRALGFGAVGRWDVPRPIEGVVGRRRHIGPMRFDIRQVQAPPLIAGVVDKGQSPVGHISGFGMFLGHPRRQAGMAHGPTGDHLAVGVGGRIGEIMPRIVGDIAMRPEIAIVGHIRIETGCWVQAVIMFKRLKPGVFQLQADR